MPTIKTKKDALKFKNIPLYLGVKQIDKIKAKENLILFNDICKKYNLKFGLIAGTLLGAVREKDFITHDEDIDLFFLEEDKENVFEHLKYFIAVGFNIARYDRRGLISIIRNGEYIDLYFFKAYMKNIRSCSGWCVPETFLVETTEYEFHSMVFNVPKDYMNYLVYEYGESWITPIPYTDFKIKYWKVLLFQIKEKLKDLLPDVLYFVLAKKAEVKMIAKYYPKCKKYL